MTNADQTKSRGIPNDTENGVITGRPTTLSLFLASPDLIAQLSLFAGDSGKQTVRPDGILEMDSEKDSAQSRKTTTDNHLVKSEDCGVTNSILSDVTSPFVGEATRENGLKLLKCCSCHTSFEDRSSQVSV